ncbi:homoserine kinase type II [Metabacillus crassostreae]|uniref:phosphotransferase n=1 Tax=Metabacillus crassostreae TaxID=929098 RepID=UPI0019585181|nr:phosphotransferase [Metabacillus crassostreae]MBM7602861.1 homoserine kinase type II [Metabacillus crassostreae]
MSKLIDAINEVVAQFLGENRTWTVSEGKSGYNNTTRYIECDEQKYIVRIYESHQDLKKVKLEHEVLLKLQEIRDLPFQVPVPLIAKNGDTMVRLNDTSMKIACMYHFIIGENPTLDHPEIIYSFGQRTGSLLKALYELKLNNTMIYRPYYEIEHTYPELPINKIAEWCYDPPHEFTKYKNELLWIKQQLVDFKQYVPTLKKLPHQLIHGDLNASNILQTSEAISAILDFEFVTNDLRVMEAAVCISELIVGEQNQTRLWENIEAFVNGFTSLISLEKAEIEALPILVQLRRLDVFVHFLGRYLENIDDKQVLEEQIVKAAANPQWLQEGGENLKLLFRN